MAGEEREKSFEQALARNFRANAAGGAQRVVCPDAEVLAAYHERALAPAQMSTCKEHITGCPQCQEILTLLEQSEAIPLDVTQQAPHEVGALLQAVRAERPSAVLQISAPRRKRAWLWAAPVGAIAASLLVWVAVQQREIRKPTEMAKNESAALPTPTTAPRLEAAPGSNQPARAYSTEDSKRKTAPRRQAENERLFSATPSAAPTDRILDTQDSLVPSAPRLTPRAGLTHDQSAQQALSGAARSLSSVAQAAPIAQSARNGNESIQEMKKFDQQASAPSLPPVPSATETVEVTSAAPAAPSNAPARQPEQKAKAASGVVAGQVPQKETVQVMKRASANSANKDAGAPLMLVANSVGPAIIAAPSGKVIWQIGAAGMIERSEDGVSWTPQPSGVDVDLAAGSAPSDQVCWVVGKHGNILRTVDGGLHWLKVRPPTLDDFTSVTATSAHQATISTATESYQTSDDGATWRKASAQ